MENTIDLIQKETDALKSQQIENLKAYTEKYRKLDLEYKGLLSKKKNIEDELVKAFSAEKNRIQDIEVEINKKKADCDKLLGDAATIEADAKEIRDNLSQDREDFEEIQAGRVKAYEEKSSALSKKQDELEEIKKGLIDEEKTHSELVEAFDDRIADLKKKENFVEKDTKLLNGLIEENRKTLKKIASEWSDLCTKSSVIDKTKTSNDAVLQEIVQEKNKLIQVQGDIAKREADLVEGEKTVKVNGAEIKNMKAVLKKKLDEAEILFQEWKNKGGNS